jgi:aminopeptidase N
MLIGKATPSETYQVLLNAIKIEKNELITNYLSGRIQNVFWTFLNDEERDFAQIKIEKEISKLLNENLSSNIKKTLFNLYASVAFKPIGSEKLYQIWKENKKIKNLFLNENDYTSLAIKLAIYQHPKASEILEEQQTRISNPDQLERFNWLLPSLSSDENVRDRFMTSLLQKENREKESWVQTALNNIHHPLRQEASRKHLKSILSALEEVQLTGDIFFPKGWLASSIGNYSSKEANDILEQFLEDNPTYNPILLKKLQQTTDDLIRAQKIKK